VCVFDIFGGFVGRVNGRVNGTPQNRGMVKTKTQSTDSKLFSNAKKKKYSAVIPSITRGGKERELKSSQQ